MIGKNVVPFAPIAPAEKLLEAQTADSGCDPFYLTDTGKNFISTIGVKPGDLIVKDPSGTPESAYVLHVVDNDNLVLDENLEMGGETYDLIRPSEVELRTALGVEWVIRSIRSRHGDACWRVAVWFSDGERTMLYMDTKLLYDKEGIESPGYPSPAEGFWLYEPSLLVGHKRQVLLRNYTLSTLDIVVYGANKTVGYNRT